MDKICITKTDKIYTLCTEKQEIRRISILQLKIKNSITHKFSEFIPKLLFLKIIDL